MKVNTEMFQRRIAALDGGYQALADHLHMERSSLHRLVNKTQNPGLQTMVDVAQGILDLEQKEATNVSGKEDFFSLPQGPSDVSGLIAHTIKPCLRQRSSVHA